MWHICIQLAMTQLGPESLNTHTISQRESIGWLHVHVCQCVHVCACVYVCVHVCAHLCVCVHACGHAIVYSFSSLLSIAMLPDDI